MRLSPIIAMRIASFEDVDRILKSITEWSKQVAAIAILRGRLVEDIAADSSGVTVEHGLGRAPKGAFVVKISETVAYSISDFTASSLAFETRSGSATVSLWVF